MTSVTKTKGNQGRKKSKDISNLITKSTLSDLKERKVEKNLGIYFTMNRHGRKPVDLRWGPLLTPRLNIVILRYQ